MIEPDTDTGTRAILPVQYEAFLPLRALDTRPGHTEFGVVTMHGLVGEHSKARGRQYPSLFLSPSHRSSECDREVVPNSDTFDTHTKPTWFIRTTMRFFSTSFRPKHLSGRRVVLIAWLVI
jgi:hypothetical protein